MAYSVNLAKNFSDKARPLPCRHPGVHEDGEIWVEQSFSPAFKARMVAGFSAGLKACSTRVMNNTG